MDSLTQAVLGASVAGAIAPAGQRRKALLLGAALGTLPDLDVLIRYDDAVENFTYHRGFSHSLFVLVPLALLLWAALNRFWAPVRGAPRRWLAAVLLALVTHPLLDAHTAYGTQLLWSLDSPPVIWSTMFIIDPLFTLPLVVGVVFAGIRPLSPAVRKALPLALAVSAAYLSWTWVAKAAVERNADVELARLGYGDAPVFSTPAPFTSLLWRIVVMTGDGYLEGYDSLLVTSRPVEFSAYPSDSAALAQAQDIWAVGRLTWFAHGFIRADVIDDRLIVTDLRMGGEPKYVFRHAVAKRGNPHWQAVPSELLDTRFSRHDVSKLRRLLWHETAQRAPH